VGRGFSPDTSYILSRPYVSRLKPRLTAENVNNMPTPQHTRRRFLKTITAAPVSIAVGAYFTACNTNKLSAEAFIAKAPNYTVDLTGLISAGLRELQVSPQEIRGKRIVLKANIVEPHRGAEHIVTNPAVVFAAAEAFLKLGADKIIVAEGSGHRRDSYAILEESGFDALFDHKRITFVDLNYDDWVTTPNAGNKTNLKSFVFPATLKQADWIVSMPKLKTHHWAGMTASMKNLFGALPGSFYGWPKNVLHNAGIMESILDINATLRPHFAIVDGITGMEGDGPIMGTAKQAGVIVMGRNLPSVDATCARLMGINPYKIEYLDAADNRLGPIKDSLIAQRGEPWESVRTDFQLLDYIEAHKGLRL
jgi:uncharacterized protein (DUF362 family)